MRSTSPLRTAGSAVRLAALVALVLSLWASPARADELSEEVDTDESIYAVQRRQFMKGHEFNVSFSVLPLDSLYIGLALGAGYTYHFNPLWGWQIGHLRYSFDVDTPAVGDLARRFNAQAARNAQVMLLLDSTVMYKLLSGKALLGQRTLVGGEVDVLLGPAVMIPVTSDPVYFGFNVGLGFRAYLSRMFSARLEVRQYETFIFKPSFGVSHVLDISLGAAINLR